MRKINSQLKSCLWHSTKRIRKCSQTLTLSNSAQLNVLNWKLFCIELSQMLKTHVESKWNHRDFTVATTIDNFQFIRSNVSHFTLLQIHSSWINRWMTDFSESYSMPLWLYKCHFCLFNVQSSMINVNFIQRFLFRVHPSEYRSINAAQWPSFFFGFIRQMHESDKLNKSQLCGTNLEKKNGINLIRSGRVECW